MIRMQIVMIGVAGIILAGLACGAESAETEPLLKQGYSVQAKGGEWSVMERSSGGTGEFLYLNTDGTTTRIRKVIGAVGEHSDPEPIKEYSREHWEKVLDARKDILAEELLSQSPDDPTFAQIKRMIAPLARPETFVGMKEYPFEVYVTADGSVGMDAGFYTGLEFSTREVDPPLRFTLNDRFVSLDDLENTVRRGLIGGYLPATQILYRQKDTNMGWEQLVFMGRYQGEPFLFVRFRITNLSGSPQKASFSVEPPEGGSIARRDKGLSISSPLGGSAGTFDDPTLRAAKTIVLNRKKIDVPLYCSVPFSDFSGSANWVFELDKYESRDLYFCLPGYSEKKIALKPEEIAPVFFGALKAEYLCWSDFISKGAQIQIPEPGLEDVYNATLVKTVTAVDGDEVRGGSVHYEGFWPYCAMHQIRVMITCGYPEYARRYMESFLKTRVLGNGTFRFDSRPKRYQVADIGDFLQVLSLYYWYTGDGTLIADNYAVIDRVVQYVRDQRNASAKKFPESDPRHGMVIGSLENDVPAQDYYYSNNGTIWNGLNDFAQALGELAKEKGRDDMLQAAKMLSVEAKEFGAQLRAGFEKGVERDAKGNVEFFHMHPILNQKGFSRGKCLYRTDERMNCYRRFQAQPRMLAGCFLADEEMAGFIRYQSEQDSTILGVRRWKQERMDDFVSFEAEVQRMRCGRSREYIMKYFAFLRTQFGEGTWSGFEQSAAVPQPGCKSRILPSLKDAKYFSLMNQYEGQHPTIAAVKMSKEIFAFDEPRGGKVWLAGGVSRNWLKDGKVVKAGNLSTRYGALDLSMQYNEKKRTLTVVVDSRSDKVIPELWIAARDPGNKGIATATDSAGNACTVQDYWVTLKLVSGRQEVNVAFQ